MKSIAIVIAAVMLLSIGFASANWDEQQFVVLPSFDPGMFTLPPIGASPSMALEPFIFPSFDPGMFTLPPIDTSNLVFWQEL